MRRAIRILLAICAVVTAADTSSAQSAPLTFTEPEARAIAQQAAVAAKGDRETFNKTFVKLARKKARNYHDGGYAVPCCIGLAVTVFSRLGYFQQNAWEQIRTLKPVADAAWPKHEVIVTLTSSDMTAPVIDRIVLKRNDLIVEPTESMIVEGDAKNLMGAVFKARAGWVGFPLKAFASEKRVKLSLMLIPIAAANNITAKVDDLALGRIYMTQK